jgi:hypothetical protein
MDSELVRLSIAAKALKCSERTLRRWADAGRCVITTQGNKSYIKADEVRELRRQKTETPPKIRKKKNLDTQFVTIELSRYDDMLKRLGEVESQNKLLLEYRLTRDEEIAKLKAEIAALKKDAGQPLITQILNRITRR